MASVLSTFSDKLLAIVAELTTAFGGDLMGRILFDNWGRKGDRELIGQVIKLINEGKKEEAQEILRARWAGTGMADEEILLTDMLAIMRSGEVNLAQALALANYLAALSVEQRKKFRHAHTLEPNHLLRYANLIQLAQLPDDATRGIFVQSAGTFDPTGWDRFVAGINQLDAQASARIATVRAARPALISRIQHGMPLVHLPAPAPVGTRRQRFLAWIRDMFDFNPLY